VDIFLGDGEHQFADAFRSERIGGNSSRGAVDGMSGFEGIVQCRCCFWLDADHLDAVLTPGGDAADESATADGNEQGIEVRRLLLEFETNRALAEQRLGLVIRVYRERARLGGPAFAGGQCFGIAFAGHNEIGPIAAYALDFFLGSHGRDENLCGHAEFIRGEGDACAVVAARGCHDTLLRDFSQQQISESAARFEGAGMLEQFEFEDEREGTEAEVYAAGLDDRRPANVRPDDLFRCADAFATD